MLNFLRHVYEKLGKDENTIIKSEDEEEATSQLVQCLLTPTVTTQLLPQLLN